MKRETLRHPKTWHLASLLGCSRPEALGYLTLLWDFTAEFAPCGNIGKFPDGAIARACDWVKDPSEFIGAMATAGWIDSHDAHRLVIHDWSQHCERWVKAKMEKLGLKFICFSTEPSVERSTEGSVERSTEPSPPRDQSNPIQSFDSPDRSVGAEPNRLENKNGKPDVRDAVIASIPELSEAALIAVETLPPNKLSYGAYSVLEEDHLSSVKALHFWFRRQLGLGDPVIRHRTRADLILVIASAIAARKVPPAEVKKSRVAIFIDTVNKGRWRKASPYVPQAIADLKLFESEKHDQATCQKTRGAPKGDDG